MYPSQHPYQPAPAPLRRRWWQHPVLIVCLLVFLPPAGIALAWTSRWTQTKKIVATVLSGLWFLLLVVSDPPKEDGGADPKPATTATAPPTTPAPTTEPPSATPTTEPAPVPTTTTPPEPTAAPTTEAPATTRAPEPTRQPTRTPAPRPTTQQPETAEPAETADESSVYYRNCTAVREAGAAPIHAGDPGYGSHLDRDGDGVACES